MLKSIPSRKLVPLQELNKDASKKEHLLNQKLDQLSRLVHKLNHMETNNHHTNHHNTTHYHHHNHHNHHNHNHNSHNTNERQKLLDRIQTLDKEAQQLLNELVSLNHRMNHVNQQQQQQQQRQNGSSSDDDDSDDDDASSEKKRLLHDNSSSNGSNGSSSDEMIELPVHMRDQIHQHGQTMNDMQRELQKWRMSVQRSNMLYSPINNSNNSSNSNNNGSGNDGGMSELDRLNRTTADGDAILSIDDSASRLLDQAHEIRGNMSYQRMLISGANAKLGGMRARFPVIDGMIVRIQQKRQRDMVALSFFIAFCVIVTWFLL